MGKIYKYKRGERGLQDEADEAMARGDDTFKSRHPCEGFHLSLRCCYTLECLECRRLRRLAKRVRKIKEADARNDKPDGVMRRTLKMVKHGLHAAACKVPPKKKRNESPEEEQRRRTANATASRDRTRRQQERSRRELAFAEDWENAPRESKDSIPTWGSYPGLINYKPNKE